LSALAGTLEGLPLPVRVDAGLGPECGRVPRFLTPVRRSLAWSRIRRVASRRVTSPLPSDHNRTSGGPMATMLLLALLVFLGIGCAIVVGLFVWLVRRSDPQQ